MRQRPAGLQGLMRVLQWASSYSAMCDCVWRNHLVHQVSSSWLLSLGIVNWNLAYIWQIKVFWWIRLSFVFGKKWMSLFSTRQDKLLDTKRSQQWTIADVGECRPFDHSWECGALCEWGPTLKWWLTSRLSSITFVWQLLRLLSKSCQYSELCSDHRIRWLFQPASLESVLAEWPSAFDVRQVL